jgi:hypothetical protein
VPRPNSCGGTPGNGGVCALGSTRNKFQATTVVARNLFRFVCPRLKQPPIVAAAGFVLECDRRAREIQLVDTRNKFQATVSCVVDHSGYKHLASASTSGTRSPSTCWKVSRPLASPAEDHKLRGPRIAEEVRKPKKVVRTLVRTGPDDFVARIRFGAQS